MAADSRTKGVRDAREYFKDRPRRRQLPLRANHQELQLQEVAPEVVREVESEIVPECILRWVRATVPLVGEPVSRQPLGHRDGLE